MSAAENTPAVEPAYVRELLSVIRELVDAALDTRSYVAEIVEVYGVEVYGLSTTPRALRARRVLEAVDGAIAEGQARL